MTKGAATEKLQQQLAHIKQLQEIIRDLIDVAMPSNWDDEDDPDSVRAWEDAIVSQGEDPQDYRS